MKLICVMEKRSCFLTCYGSDFELTAMEGLACVAQAYKDLTIAYGEFSAATLEVEAEENIKGYVQNYTIWPVVNGYYSLHAHDAERLDVSFRCKEKVFHGFIFIYR